MGAAAEVLLQQPCCCFVQIANKEWIMNTIKLVVSDIDGTLIRGREPLPQSVKMAVKELKKQGIAFTFATGRLPYMITPYMEELGLDAPVCACNGTLLYQGRRILEHHPLKLSLLRPLVLKARSLDMTVLYSVEGVEYCMWENESVLRKIRERGHYHEIRLLTQKEWETLPVDKVNILDEKQQTAQLASLESQLRDVCDITHYGDSGLELVAAGFGKAYGLTRLSELMKIPLNRVLAIGDNENDNGMLQLAGIGGVVGNAAPGTKAYGDLVAKEEAGEGAAELIRKVCFQEG